MGSKVKAESCKLKAGGSKKVQEEYFVSCFMLPIAIGIALCFLLSACSTKSENNKDTSSSKFKQYYNQGEQLYQRYCSNCHQKNGTGLGRVYPPLNTSDYMEKNFNETICILRYGKQGGLIVNGKDFNHTMPGIPLLSDLEIAEIATYIYNTWEHDRGIVDVKGATAILQTCPPVQ